MGESFEVQKMPWFVYMVRCADGSLYTGVTNDLEERLASHNAGKGAKYTAARRPVVLVYHEPAESKNSALKRELQIKRRPKAKKESLIESDAGRVKRPFRCRSGAGPTEG